MSKLDDLKKEYDRIYVPDDFDEFMDIAINSGKQQMRRRLHIRLIRLAFAATAIIYLVILNTSPAFAKAVFKVPIIREVSQLLCVREYKEEDAIQSLSVKIPVVKNTGNAKMEKQVNAAISEHIDATVKQIQQEHKEFMNNYKKANTTPVMKTSISIDYKITANKGNLLSFQIITTYVANTSYQEHQIFNLDLKTGKELTLQDLFHDSYKSLINTEIKKQIQSIQRKDTNALYFTEKNGFTGIKNNQQFYIDNANNVVIIFEKYEIAPGYMGEQEFKIPCKNVQTYING